MMTIRMDPDILAGVLGVHVTSHTGGEKGRYYGGGLISLRDDLGPVNRRCTLAHELGHYVLGHDPAASGWWSTRQENQADQWAANLLITPSEYKAAELAHGPHEGAIASELEVTNHLVTVWRDNYERTPA